MKNIFFTDESVKMNCLNSEKYFFTEESVKRQITDSISENLTDSDLESTIFHSLFNFSPYDCSLFYLHDRHFDFKIRSL